MILTMLQQRPTAAVPQFNPGDVNALFAMISGPVNAIIGPLIHLAAFLSVLWLLFEFSKVFWKKGAKPPAMLEIIGFALVLVLMRG